LLAAPELLGRGWRAREKIESAVAPTQSIDRGSAHLCITDPLGGR